MFESRYADKFGFVEEEVHAMITHLDILTNAKDIADWYDSYSAGGSVSLYNPWSIIAFCDSDILKPYWVETGMFYYICELFIYTITQ